MRTLPWGSRKTTILALLEERYPDKKIPRGALVKLEGDWSYIYAYQVAHSAGYTTSRSTSFGPTRAGVLADAAKKYPCQEVPHGYQQALAEKYGVSHQRISQILRTGGYAIKYSTSKERTCRDCGGEVGKGKSVCDSCQWVPVSCSSCGVEYHAPRWDIIARARQHDKNAGNRGKAMNGGYLFCRKSCRKDRAVEYMIANPEAGLRQVAAHFGVTENCVRQWRRTMVKA